jgi:pimeloyl-ACP methyl ester carboxylesterase
MRYPSRIAGISLISGSVSPELEPKAVWRKWIDMPIIRGLLPVTMRVSNEELMPLRLDLSLIEDDWDEITIPVSIIHGTRDVLVPYANVDYMQRKLVNADTILLTSLEGQSHFILWTHQHVITEQLHLLMDQAEL